jgi:dCMP deaminase
MPKSETLDRQLQIDKYYLREAYKYARDNSDDLIAQTGAILVTNNSIMNPNNIVAKGANKLPKGVKKIPERLEKPDKYLFIGHAERAAIYDAAKRGIKTNGLIMYCPWFTCSDCAIGTIKSGISEIIGHTGPEKHYQKLNANKPKKQESKWTRSIKAGLEMINESEIKIRWVDGKIGGIKLIFCGDFEP